MTAGAASGIDSTEGAGADARRGPLPLRPLGVGELLDGAVRLVRATPAAAFAIGFPFALARTVVALLITAGTLDGGTGGRWAQILGGVFMAALFGTMRTGLLAPLFTATIIGRPVTAGEALSRAGRAGVLPLVVVAVVVAFGDTAGLVALVVGGVWLWGVWAVAAPAIVLERLGVIGGLRRSFRLASGLYWRTWGVRALGSLVTYVLAALIAVPFQALAGYLSGTNPLRVATEGISHPAIYLTVLSVGSLLGATVAGPVSAAIDVLLYTDLRMRREGMDIVMGLPREPAT